MTRRAFGGLAVAAPVWARVGRSFGLQQTEPSFRAAVEVVNVLCTVRRGNRYVTTLQREDFEVFEDGVRQEVSYFALESGDDAQPLNVALLVDTSGSVKDKLEFQQQAAGIFFRETLRPGKDLAAVIQFDSELNLVRDFTDDVGLLERSIDGIRAGGATKLYDAIWVAVEDLLQHQVGRRVIVVLSDGDDTQSETKDKDAIQLAQERDVMIFAIGVRSPRARANFGKLKEFARDTGGFFVDSRARLDDLEAAFSRINEAVKNQYSIGYTSSNPKHDGTFRTIEVRLRDRDLKIIHRRGYYSPSS
jgi:Ca-activated chloride channel family protein